MAYNSIPPSLDDNAPASQYAAYTRNMAGDGWHNITLASGVTADLARYTRVAGLVIIQLRNVKITSGNEITWSQGLPVGFRPVGSEWNYEMVQSSGVNPVSSGWVTTGGNIRGSFTPGTLYRFSIVYPAF